jgi:hypothetical protein
MGGAKVALGDTHEALNVFGTSTLVPNPGPTQTAAGGQFAAPSNLGRTTRDTLAIVPELELGVAYQFGHHWQAYVAYDFLYWSRVVRPGRQVDLVVDTRGDQIDPGFTGDQVAFPRPMFNRSDFWAQGITFGLSATY